MKNNKIKPASRINKAWWITFGAILFAAFFMSAAEGGVEEVETDEVSNVDKLINKTGINAFVGGFNELNMTEDELAEKRAAAAEKLAAENVEAAKRLEETEAAKHDAHGLLPDGVGQIVMILVGLLLIYLAIAKGFEPLLLLPIGFGGILANIPVIEMAHAANLVGQPDGFLHVIYSMGIENGLFPLFIFMGVGAMTDFGPLIANPKTALLGAAAQFGEDRDGQDGQRGQTKAQKSPAQARHDVQLVRRNRVIVAVSYVVVVEYPNAADVDGHEQQTVCT